MATKQNSTIGDYFDLVNGYAFKGGDFIESGIPVIKIKNVKANRMLYDELAYVSHEFLTTRADKIAQPGDLLITMSGNRFDGSPDTWVGKVAQFKEDLPHLVNQRVGILKPKNESEVERRFFSYTLSSEFYQKEFIAIATSSGGQANLSPAQILGARVEVPPLSKQRAIASVLGALDDMIELNQRMNKTLEALAQTLFISWFVDAVRDKLPTGWKTGTLSDFCNVQGGFAYKSGDFISAGHPVIKIKNITDNKDVNVEDVDFISEAVAEKTKDFWLDDGDLVMAMTGATVGKFGLHLNPSGLACVLNQRVGRFIPVRRHEGKNWFLFCALSQKEIQAQIIAVADGSAQPNISAKGICSAELVVPPDELVQKFNNRVDDLFKMLLNNRKQSRTLAALRDTLLPKLLSGELRVVDKSSALEVSG